MTNVWVHCVATKTSNKPTLDAKCQTERSRGIQFISNQTGRSPAVGERPCVMRGCGTESGTLVYSVCAKTHAVSCVIISLVYFSRSWNSDTSSKHCVSWHGNEVNHHCTTTTANFNYQSTRTSCFYIRNRSTFELTSRKMCRWRLEAALIPLLTIPACVLMVIAMSTKSWVLGHLRINKQIVARISPWYLCAEHCVTSQQSSMCPGSKVPDLKGMDCFWMKDWSLTGFSKFTET